MDSVKINKKIYQIVRLYLMCFDVLEKCKILTYRENDIKLLLEIREGKFLKDNKLTDDFMQYLQSLENTMQELKETTTLPEKPNYKKLNDFVTDCNSKIINNTVIKYKEPLYQVNL